MRWRDSLEIAPDTFDVLDTGIPQRRRGVQLRDERDAGLDSILVQRCGSADRRVRVEQAYTARSPPLLARKVMMTIAPFFVAVGALSVSATQTWTVLASLGIAALGVGLWVGNLARTADGCFRSRQRGHGLRAGRLSRGRGWHRLQHAGRTLERFLEYIAVFACSIMLQPLGVAGLWLFPLDPQHKVVAETG